MGNRQGAHRLLPDPRAKWFRITAVSTAVVTVGAIAVVAGTSMAASAQPARPVENYAATAAGVNNQCHLGNGIKHVVEITFDNVHYFRDNPNVPSDLEQMPNLLNFFEDNGTFLANNHTPLIAHTADDILTTYTGLYGDRAGMPVSNDYQSYNTDGSGGSYGTTDTDDSFAYWTDRVDDTSSSPSPDRDQNASMAYAAKPPATSGDTNATQTTPAPWVPFTSAGCDVGEFSTANTVLENTSPDISEVFGANSPEEQQLNADPDSYKDPETADYVGVAVHCAKNSPLCTNATGERGNQTTTSHTAVPDLLPDEPGGYNGYEALFGAKYVMPEIGGGQDNLMHNGYQVTNSAGQLVDENGNPMLGEYTSIPGFPGFDPTASQSLAYMADMLEAGIPVVYSYISDVHGNEDIQGLSSKGEPCYDAGSALGSGSACYLAQTAYYNQAFGTFFKRLAADGINKSNTLFILSSDEGDHEAGANVGRAIQPTPASCDGVTTLCTYPTGDFGELEGNVTGLLAEEKHDTTKFGMEYDTAPEYYINGDPGPDTTATRTFERDVAGLTADNPYSGGTQQIANYLADPTEEAILHMVNADPARTPTVAEFAKPDYYLEQGNASCDDSVTGTSASSFPADCVSVDDGYAWDHGDFAAEINTNYVAFVGPGVRQLGLQGDQPNQGPNSAGANSGQTIAISSGTTGPWTDETDIQPTMMYLTGLRDRYVPDGRVITQILARPNQALSDPAVTQLGACYKQLNSSVGEFGSYTLEADTAAIESDTTGDSEYLQTDKTLANLDKQRDGLAEQIKNQLNSAEFSGQPIFEAPQETALCQALISTAKNLAQSTSS
jgi:hypothetical protein